MNDKFQTLERPRYVWPWFVLAAFVLGAGLFLLWVRAEVQRTRAHRDESQTDARPHPGPLPQARENRSPASRDADGPGLRSRPSTDENRAITSNQTNELATDERLASLSPGERAGVRASVNTISLTQSNDNRLAEFRDVLHGGDASAGRKIFFDKPETNCGKCHKAGGQGGDNGPPLDGIGAKQSREFILESILHPNAVIPTNYETVIVLLKSGGGTSGTIKSETDSELVVITPDSGPVTIRKAEVQERMKGASPMPEGIWQSLTKEDLRNLIEFVATLPGSARIR